MSKFQYLDVLTNTETPTPVKFSEFVTSPDYCNYQEMYQFWLDEGDSTSPDVHEIVIDGSLGGGKTVYSSFRLVYFLYCLFLNGDKLRKVLGVGETSDLYVLYFSVSMTQANRSGFKEIRNVIDNCKWFKENYPRDMSIDSEIRFPNRVNIIFASGEGHAISLNVLGFILDEANFKKGVGLGMESEYSAVTQLYSQLMDRQYSRFATPEGLKSLAMLVSSASYQTSFVAERKNKVLQDEHARYCHAVAYKIKPQNYSKEMFEVFIGTDTLNPQIIESDKHKKSILKVLNLPAEIADSYFVEVPESLRPRFEENIYLALQNHAGVSTQVQGKLVTNLNLIQDAYYENKHPWFPDYQVTLSNRDDVALWDYLLEDNIEERTKPHCFFLDLSLTGDSGGFSCVRLDDYDSKLCTHVFTVEIVPPPFPGATRIKKIQDFVVDLSTIVNIAAFASDQFQSAGIRQEINAELGLEDIRISIDSTDLYYLEWMRALVDKRFKMLYYPTLHREIKEAQHDLKRRRVVKAAGSTDDCLQSLVGAHYLATHIEAFTGEVPVNIVGRNSVERIARALGYK